MKKSNTQKPYNNGTWTQGRFDSFIKSALRAASNRWGPKYSCKKQAWVKRGIYRCAGYGTRPHDVPATLPPAKGNKRRINNSIVDHILPVIPVTGFTTWDEVIKRMFCEEDGFQLLCSSCHSAKTKDENEQRKKN